MKIRNALLADAGRLSEIYAYYVLNTAITFDTVPPSPEAFRRTMAEIMKKYPYLVIENDSGGTVGYSYANVLKDRAAYDFSCETTVYIDRNEKGKGYGKALYLTLEERLKERGIKNMYACIGDPIYEDEYLTKDSEKFHSALGFVKVGEFHKCGYKFGRWYNMIWMEKLIGHKEG